MIFKGIVVTMGVKVGSLGHKLEFVCCDDWVDCFLPSLKHGSPEVVASDKGGEMYDVVGG